MHLLPLALQEFYGLRVVDDHQSCGLYFFDQSGNLNLFLSIQNHLVLKLVDEGLEILLLPLGWWLGREDSVHAGFVERVHKCWRNPTAIVGDVNKGAIQQPRWGQPRC